MVICSANKQYFACLPIKNNNYRYKIIKVDDNYSFTKIDLKFYSKCISNFDLPDFINRNVYSTIEKLEYINLEDKIYDNFFAISNNITNNNTILQPIYISNNKLFD